MKRTLLACALCVTLVGCAGMFTPGPVDPLTGKNQPSPWAAGVEEAARNYDESPWEVFGPWGAGVAGVLAAIAGVKKGTEVYKRRQAETKPNE